MKIAFKVMSILMLIYYGIIAIIGVLGIAGVGAATVGKTGGEAAFGGVAILGILLLLIPTAMAIFAAIYGLKANYDMCFKLSAVLMVLSIISFIASDNKGSAILGLIFAIAYCVMAKKLDNGAF